MSVSRFLKEVGRPVAYYPNLARMIGSVNAAVLLCQLLYWSDNRSSDPENWIYKTQPEIEEETGLTRRKQEKAREILIERGFLQEKRRGSHGTLHFRLDLAELDRQWDEWQKAPMAQTANDECTKAPNANGANRHSINKDSEITTETTTENLDITARVDSVLTDYSETVGRDISDLHFQTLRAWRLLILNRLQEGWDERKLHLIFVGCSKDDWPQRKKYNSITDLLTKHETMDRMINLAKVADELTPGRNGHGSTQRNSQPKRKPTIAERLGEYDQYFRPGSQKEGAG